MTQVSTEVDGIVAYFESTRCPGRVTSTLRPGAVTVAGNPSRHCRGLAVDFAGLRPTVDSAELAAIFDAFVPVEGRLNELIYAGPQVAYNIKAGRRVKKYATAIHHNHVHVAVDVGVVLPVVAPMLAPTASERVADTDGREDMADPVDALVGPDGGVWVLTRDGGVRSYKGAPFHGSYPGLPAEWRQGERTFVRIEARDDGTPGYMLISSGDERYRFP